MHERRVKFPAERTNFPNDPQACTQTKVVLDRLTREGSVYTKDLGGLPNARMTVGLLGSARGKKLYPYI